MRYLIASSVGLACLLTSLALGQSGTGGNNFDRLADADRAEMQKRFTQEIWPLLQRHGKDGCVGCHNGKIVAALRMSGDPDKDFRMLVKEGFFLPNDQGSLLDRVNSKVNKRKMPPGQRERWAEADIQTLARFVADLDKKQKR